MELREAELEMLLSLVVRSPLYNEGSPLMGGIADKLASELAGR